MTLFCQKTIKL